MQFRSKTLAAAITAVTAFSLTSIVPAHAATNHNECWKYKRAERAFARKSNAARSNAGVGKLRLDPELSKVARRHTREMVNKNLLHHTTSNALRRRVTNWSTLGENVGVGGTPTSLHKAFMNSPGHKANIVNNAFAYVGVGVKKAHGRMWVTVIFEGAANPGTRLRMPRCS